MPRFDLVVFDMAGTTVEDLDVVNDAIRTALASDGVAVSREQVQPWMGVAKPVAIQALLEGGEARADAQRVDRVHEAFRAEMLRAYREGPVRAILGIPELLKDLREAGTRVALDTGFSRDIADAILERLEWRVGANLDASVTSDEAPGRPAPDMVFEAMRRCGVTDVSRVAKVGDTPSDMEQGLAARCGKVIGVAYGTHRAEDLARSGVEIVRTVAELRNQLL